MKTNALTSLSLAFIAATVALGGCAGVESESQDMAGAASEEDVVVPSQPQVTKGDITSFAFSNCPFGTGCTWTGQNGTGTGTVYSFSASGGTGVCNTISRNVLSAMNTYGGGVAGFSLFETSNCSGPGVFIPTGTGNATNFGTTFFMKSYIILR